MIGPNGGGKTTLIKLMLGLLEAGSGMVRIFGQPPSRVSHRIGYVPQDVHINKNFPVSALDVVLMGKIQPGLGWSRPSREDRVAALDALNQVEMAKYCDYRIGELSGGQKQRVFVARALVTDPQLLFLDEPTASIDTKGQGEFYSLLKELNKTVSIIIVSHDLMDRNDVSLHGRRYLPG
jgi:zinc transport system ATP-binding protein